MRASRPFPPGRRIPPFLLLVPVLLAAAACRTGRVPPSFSGPRDAGTPSRASAAPPRWVALGSGAFTFNAIPEFHGVGSRWSGTPAPSGFRQMGGALEAQAPFPPEAELAAAQSLADEQARERLAGVLARFMDLLRAGYLAENPAGVWPAGFAKSQPDPGLRDFGKALLAASAVTERWRDEDGTFYALAVLEAYRLKKILAAAGSLDPRFRDHIRSRSDAVFEALSAQR